ncbi:rho GTPase-activating protein 29 isoform X1 [Monodelphis domestica]|uniref:rho GTPase-activating protein 29 isoform X1 n=1 Tax=Monodelphis domestica TaxID=13616 RepID=UPI0024E218AD|nr:rho GTPase-activating protein 29 isoform X1 [Monodelphis domestica]XP_016284524.2 rho GTPase-activating protein 29 isoform X1 [Monodelphis domestica]
MLRQNGGSNKRGLPFARFSLCNLFALPNSGNWRMGHCTKSSSSNSINSNSDCCNNPIIDPDYVIEMLNDVRKFAEVLLSLKEAIISEESQDCLHNVAQERVGELLQVLKAFVNKHQTFNSDDILTAAGVVVAKVNAVNAKDINEEDKRHLCTEVFSSIETLAFTFGNIVSDFLMGDVDSSSPLGLSLPPESQLMENISLKSLELLHDDHQGPLWPKNLDSILRRNEDGVELALSYAKAWSKYIKDVVTWVEKKISLDLEYARNVAKMAETTKVIIRLQEFMPFQTLFMNAFDNDMESSQLSQKTAAALQANKFVQPLVGRKGELDKQRKEMKDVWLREQKKMQETEASLKKAKLLCIQQQNEYEKAKSSTVCAEEECLSSSAGLGRETSKQLEKKRKLEEEALQKVEDANEHYKVIMTDMEERRNDLENTKSEILTRLRELLFQCDLTLKAAVVNLFQMQHMQVGPLPVNHQTLCEKAKLYDPGRKFAEFVKAKTSPKDDIPIKSCSFENSKIDGKGSGSTNNQHAFHGNLRQNSGDCPFRLLDDIGSPLSRSEKIGEKRCYSSVDIPGARGPLPFRSWSVGNQCGGMWSDSESAGGSSESRSMDSPPASPGDFKHKLPRTPSTGTMSSADDLDEREPPPSETGLNERVPDITSSPGLFRNSLMSKAAASHKLRKLRAPSKCRECDSLIIFHGAECEECFLACHKKCLETLRIGCGHKKLHGKLHLFGVEFAQAATNAPDGIPFIIKKCTSEIESRALNVKGIYRVNGAKTRVEKLCQSFENGNDLVELSELNAHDISNVLKLYLRQLPEPLFLFHLYDELIGLAKESKIMNEDTKEPRVEGAGADLSTILKKLKDCLHKLPDPNYATAKFLLGHLHRVAQESDENKMTAKNLGIVFGPTLIRPRETNEPISLSSLNDYPHQARVLELLIVHHAQIFEVSPKAPAASTAPNGAPLPEDRDSREGAASLENGTSETSPFRITKCTLRSPRIKRSARPMSLPVEQFLPPNHTGTVNSDRFVRSCTIEETPETRPFPNSRLSCYEPQTWDKRPRRNDRAPRTATIVPNALQDHRAQDGAETCAASLGSDVPSFSAVQASKPEAVPVRAMRVRAEGCSSDSNPLAAFRARRTLQPPPGTFYKPPPYPKVRGNEESFPETCFRAASVGVSREQAVSVTSESPEEQVNDPAAGPEELHTPDVKLPCQRLRPKRIQDLEQREAQFV